MGEAVFYLRARFESEEAAEKALPAINEFLEEAGDKAYEWWQSHRGMQPENFWPKFRPLFPQTYEFLTSLGLVGGDCNNALSGRLSFGNEQADVAGDEVRYAAEVWHFADWRPLVAWIKSHFGAIEAGYVSDEYLDPYDNVVLE